MDINHIPIPTYSKEMENEYAMSSVRRCAFIKIDSLEFVRSFESTPEILITMSMENRRNKKLMSPRFSANNGNPFSTDINAEYQLIYSHNVKYHRDPILRIAVENTRAKTFSRHRSIAATLVSMQQIVQHDFDGTLMLYECHVSEKTVLARIQLHIRSQYIDDQESWEENSEDPDENPEVFISFSPPSHPQSSDNDISGGLARFSRSIRNIFQPGNGSSVPHSHSRTPVYDSIVDGPVEPSETAESAAAEALSDGLAAISPVRGHDLGVEVARRAFSHVPQRSRHALYTSDGGSSVGSHGFEWESTPTMLLEEEKAEKSDGNALRALQALQAQLDRFEEGVKREEWRPVVMLVEDTANLRVLAQYLTSNVGNEGGVRGRKGASGRCGGGICSWCRWRK